MDQAEAAYRKAIALKPEYAPAHNNLAHILLRGGHLEEALALLTRAVTLAPDYADAQNNLGTTLHMLNRSDEAHAAFRSAVRLAPENADAHINLSNCLFDTGKMRDAEAAAAEGVRLDPGMSRGHIAHGNALRAQGNLRRAEACYRAALTCEPDSSDARKHLAETLCEAGRLSEGFSVYIQHAQLVYGTGAPPSAGSIVAHKQRHDDEQKAWLGDPVTDFHLADGNRIAGPAVYAAGKITQVKQTGRVPQPRIAIIDDLLTTEALEKLLRFCMDSTIWRQIYDDGYLGAFPEHGFAPPLLAQIAEELRSVHPAVIGDHPLLQFWAFKYDSTLRGTRTHADFAAVNVNFWITPDQANLDPGHGGMVLWDVGAPLDWDFAKYNAAEDDIRAFLKLHKAEPIVVPYRANRAVVFDSDLFHETDTIHFKPGYENRRINITLLFGHRHAMRQAL
jgi:tetratricopeptide (TPR) repeat protein